MVADEGRRLVDNHRLRAQVNRRLLVDEGLRDAGRPLQGGKGLWRVADYSVRQILFSGLALVGRDSDDWSGLSFRGLDGDVDVVVGRASVAFLVTSLRVLLVLADSAHLLDVCYFLGRPRVLIIGGSRLPPFDLTVKTRTELAEPLRPRDLLKSLRTAHGVAILELLSAWPELLVLLQLARRSFKKLPLLGREGELRGRIGGDRRGRSVEGDEAGRRGLRHEVKQVVRGRLGRRERRAECGGREGEVRRVGRRTAVVEEGGRGRGEGEVRSPGRE